MSKQLPVTFERMATKYYPAWGFRPNTPMYQLEMNFVFLNGGMGDYITWLTPIRWLASEATWIKGTLVCPVYFKELAEHFLKDFPEWGLRTYQDIQGWDKADTTPFRGPVILQNESLNATGAHLMTCGWVYFTNKQGPPPGWENYSQFKQADLDAIFASGGFNLPDKYVVVTVGKTTNSRKVKAEYWNHVIEHVVDRGLTPVFLGKAITETGNPRNIVTEFDKGLKLDLGINLLDKTSLLQAAAIMSKAQAVVGHDNGLLHLAGCTDVPIVFGYNLASPEHRRPIRKVGKVYDVHLQEGELACNFCQSKTNFVIGYNFRECFYSDLKCMDLLFANKAEKWKAQLNRALDPEYE